MAVILDGKALSEKRMGELKERVDAMKAKGKTIGLSVILVGDNPASQVYVRNKGRACEELGLEVKNITYYKSQPWGVAGDVLSGYWCDVDGDPTLHMDASELGRAVWAGPDQIPGQPDDLSLTNEMMCLWRDTHFRR